MSKSLGNFVGVNEPADTMFGKLMSISDELMARYYPLLLRRPLPPEIHPMQAKKDLALAIVEMYHSAAIAQKTLEEWNLRFSEKRLGESDLPLLERDMLKPDNYSDFISLVGFAYQNAFGMTKSRGDVRRLIEQGSVQLDGEKITDPKAAPPLRSGQVLRLDKTHAVRVK
jgi:tyrosyl-tRNA synthetase